MISPYYISPSIIISLITKETRPTSHTPAVSLLPEAWVMENTRTLCTNAWLHCMLVEELELEMPGLYSTTPLAL